MADFTFPSPSSPCDAPLFSTAAAASSSSSSSSSSSAAVPAFDDAFEDACSICLEPFTSHDPATVTCCKHEYHLQCILEWSQRSKECPICWQLLVLKDPASQELLAAVEVERLSRLRNPVHALSTNRPLALADFDQDEDSYSDDSDFEERVMQHLAAAANRTRYVRRRERQRSSGLGPSQVLVFSSPSNTLPEEGQNLSGGSLRGNSPSRSIPSVGNIHSLPAAVPPVNAVSTASVNRDNPFKPRILFGQPPTDSPQGTGSSETVSFSDSIKSKWSTASARYKESLSKGTRGIKEKLIARNNSVKELSKGVQREMSAGIAGFTRFIERLDLTSKQTAPVSDFGVGTPNSSLKGKGAQENVIAQALEREEIEHHATVEAPSGGQLDVPQAQRGH